MSKKNDLTNFGVLEERIYKKIAETFFTKEERESTLVYNDDKSGYKLSKDHIEDCNIVGIIKQEWMASWENEESKYHGGSIEGYFAKKVGATHGIDFHIDEFYDGKDKESKYIGSLTRATCETMNAFGKNKKIPSIETIAKKITSIVDKEIEAISRAYQKKQNDRARLN